MKDKILIGAHMSIEGGVHNAFYEAQKFGATIMQIFTTNQRRWKGKDINKNELKLWEKAREETGITNIMSHNNYLTNLGSCKKELLKKSKESFEKEIERCQNLKLDFLTFHPGSAVDQTEIDCLDTICESLLGFEKLLNIGKPKLLLETTAGQGRTIGYRFDQLGYIIDKVKKNINIGVCFDTCHVFAAGYDIRSKKEWEKTLDEFDEEIGLKYLNAFHLNDSSTELGSRKDRHASLGEGKIGLECFKFLMQSPKTRFLPKYLETPYGVKLWKDEIIMLKNFWCS